MKPQRLEELVSGVAQDFQSLQTPLSSPWCMIYNMDVDEVKVLSEKLAQILRGYCTAPDYIKAAVLVASASSNKEEARVGCHIVLRQEIARVFESNQPPQPTDKKP